MGFNITASGWYLLSVSARVKSEKQRGQNETDDEDLRLKIDQRPFPQLKNPQRFFDSPAAFSGGKLHNARQTISFVLFLEEGAHTLSFIPDHSAFVEIAEIKRIESFPNLIIDLNETAEKAGARPWLTVVLVDVGLVSFKVSASFKWRFPDGDDLKVVVDGEIKKNNLSLLHKNWIFASSVLKTLFGKGNAEKTFSEALSPGGLHYLEFWADESPTINSLGLELKTSDSKIIKQYKNGVRGENYNRFDGEIFEVVNNWNRQFLDQEDPPPLPLDPNLIKAVAYIESRLGFGTSPTGQPAYPDVLQVADKNNPAIHTLKNDGWTDPNTGKIAREFEWVNGQTTVLEYKDAKVDEPVESLRWGVRWLYHKAQGIKENGGRFWKSWEQAVADYNGGGDSDYQRKVYKVYRDGADSSGYKLWSLLLLLAIFSAFPILSAAMRGSFKGSNVKQTAELVLSESTKAAPAYEINETARLDSENRLAFVKHVPYSAVGLSVIDNSGRIKYFLEDNEIKEVGGEVKGPGEYVQWVEVGDFNGDQKKEVAVEYLVSGTGLFHPFYLYTQENESFKLLLKLINGVSHAQLTDLNDDGIKEIIYSYSLDATGSGPRSWTIWKDVWRWEGSDLVKSNSRFPNVYRNLTLFYDYLLTDSTPDEWLSSYYPMLRCLKSAAQSNINGIVADGEMCTPAVR